MNWKPIEELTDDYEHVWVKRNDVWATSAIVHDGVPGVWVGNTQFAPIRHVTHFCAAPEV